MAGVASWMNEGVKVIIFVGLSVTGVCMTVLARLVKEAEDRSALRHIGAAIFGAGLTFFLLSMVAA
jgi:hypothetical protein